MRSPASVVAAPRCFDRSFSLRGGGPRGAQSAFRRHNLPPRMPPHFQAGVHSCASAPAHGGVAILISPETFFVLPSLCCCPSTKFASTVCHQPALVRMHAFAVTTSPSNAGLVIHVQMAQFNNCVQLGQSPAVMSVLSAAACDTNECVNY
jgi:hypothetical protein